MQTTTRTPKVIVVGGGFAGIGAVQKLQKSRVACDITLLSDKPYFEYFPALYKLVTGSLAIEVSVPLRTIFPSQKVSIVQGTYLSTDPSRQVISVKTAEGTTEIAYDYLVLALGSETNYFNIPGLAELSFSFKSVKEAMRLKAHFCALMADHAKYTKDEMVSRLHVVIVGGGPSGVELAGDLKTYLTEAASEFGIDPSLVTIDLIEAAPRILMSMSPRVSRKAEQRLRKMGINIFTNRALASQDIEAIKIQDMNMQAQTVIWTAGTRIRPLFTELPGVTLTDRKRVQVSETLSLPHDNHIFIAGDGAGTPYSGLAQTAIYDGAYVGSHIARLIEGKDAAAYKPHKISYVIPIGDYWALWSIGDHVFTGIIPWLLRSVIDFRYFTSIVPLSYVFEVFRKGKKYRESKTYCPIDGPSA